MSSQNIISSKASKKYVSFDASPIYSVNSKNKQVKIYHNKGANGNRSIKANLENEPTINLKTSQNNVLSDKSIEIKVKEVKHVRFSI